MMQILLTVLLSSLSLLSFAQAESTARHKIPSARAFLGFEDRSLAEGNIPASQLKRTTVSCALGDTLYPTNPQATMKLYHTSAYGTYDHGKLSGFEAACKTPGYHDVRRARKSCLRGDILVFHALSDTYVDACGTLYRGVWDVLFLRRKEKMETLVGKGRTVYRNPKSDYAADYIDGNTHSVQPSEFLFLAEPLPGDAEKVQQEREFALRTRFQYDEQTKTFSVK